MSMFDYYVRMSFVCIIACYDLCSACSIGLVFIISVLSLIFRDIASYIYQSTPNYYLIVVSLYSFYGYKGQWYIVISSICFLLLSSLSSFSFVQVLFNSFFPLIGFIVIQSFSYNQFNFDLLSLIPKFISQVLGSHREQVAFRNAPTFSHQNSSQSLDTSKHYKEATDDIYSRRPHV